MIPLDEVKKHLPQYLSAESTKELFKALEQFPKNIDSRMYTTNLSEEELIFQGDVLRRLPIVNLPDPTILYVPCMILSNTCDNDHKNSRYIPRNLSYAPVTKLVKLIKLLEDQGVANAEIEAFILTIKKQHLTQCFYLPKGDEIEDESVVFLDKINSCCNSVEVKNLRELRVLCLSDYGFYLLLFKLSVHLTRVQEKVDRNMGTVC